ncbi:MAG: hypothetical protein HYY23_10930 [Verrucomicrobia bacterium]|nr:hypothetical protein [Verrucomicrobiota bacterium]
MVSVFWPAARISIRATLPNHQANDNFITPLCNLYVPMLERMGTPVEAFGDSTGPLEIG